MKTQQKRNQGVIIEVIYLKHKKQSKQHLSQNNDPAVRREISSVKHVSNNQIIKVRQHSTISKSSDSQNNKSKNYMIVCIHAFIPKILNDEMPQRMVQYTSSFHLYKNAKISM